MRWFLHLKTRTKLSLGFGLILLLFLGLIGMAQTSLRVVHQAGDSVADALLLRNNTNIQRAALMAAAHAPVGVALDERLQEVVDSVSENDSLIQQLQAQYGADPESRALLEKMLTSRDDYLRVRDSEVIPLIRAQKKDEAFALILGAQSERIEQFRTHARAFTQHLKERSEASRAQAQWAFGGLGLSALVIMLGMIFGMRRLIAKPLREMVVAAEQIAVGDLAVILNGVERRDEVGVLLQAFQHMIDSLSTLAGRAKQIATGDLTVSITPHSERDVLGNAFAGMALNLRHLMQELQETVATLADDATEIMVSTTQLAANAMQSVSAVSETAVAVEQMKNATQLSSHRATTVAERAQQTMEITQRGERAVAQTIAGMSGLHQQMKVVAETILSLSAQGQNIGDILTSVDDFAAQSKVLAVNAAIEAAKAGAEGKAFAVVSQEVKALAVQSKQSTTQVRGILKDIQKATHGAVLATELGSKEVEAGVRQSGAAGEAIRALSTSMTEAAEVATQIAASSAEQSAGMVQVATAMGNLQTASRQAAAVNREVAASAQRLHDLGQHLKQAVAQFKV